MFRFKHSQYAIRHATLIWRYACLFGGKLMELSVCYIKYIYICDSGNWYWYPRTCVIKYKRLLNNQNVFSMCKIILANEIWNATE